MIGLGLNVNNIYRGGSGFDAAYQAVLSRASTLGFGAPSANQQVLQNTLVSTLKAEGIWNELDALYITATDGNKDYATINWISPADFQLSQIGPLVFTTNQGFKGNAANATLNTGIVMGTDTTKFNTSTREGSIGGWAYDVKAAGSNPLFGDLVSVNNLRGGTSDTIMGKGVGYGGTTTGLYWMNISGNDSVQYLNDQIVAQSSNVAGAITTPNTMHLLSEGGANYFSADKIAIFFIGGDLSTKSSAVYNAFNTYMAAL